MEERIQKIMAAAGIASRRAAEEIILEGRVRVNGQVVSELGAKADPEKDHIKVDGKLINPKQPKTYLMLNKPAGCVTTLFDPEGRPTVTELLKGVRVRVYPVGRLDYDTEGLLLLTNDGDFAFRVTHPSHELPKTYQVKIKGVLEDRQIENLEQGVFLKDGKTAPARVKKLRKEESNSWIEITIHEGRKRQVRRMIDHTGHSVIKLKRVRIGNLGLGDLPLGAFRHLTPEEVKAVQDMAQGGDGIGPGKEIKPSRRPASAGHIPEFIEGPKPAGRMTKKEPSRKAGANRFPRRPAGGGQGSQEGRERTFEKKRRPFGRQGESTERRRSGQGGKRFVKPSFGGERPQWNRGARGGEGPGPERGPGRTYVAGPVSREQGDRRHRPRPFRSGQEERRSGKPFFKGAARPLHRSDAAQGTGTRPGADRSFTASRVRPQERGAGPDAGSHRQGSRNEWRHGGRSRGSAPVTGDRGPRNARQGRSSEGNIRGRSRTGPGPAGRHSRNAKGPGSRRP